MTIVSQTRGSDSPFVDAVMYGNTLSAGSTIRPSESHWYLVLLKVNGASQLRVVAPLPKSSTITYGEGGELVWIRLKLGTFMPHFPLRDFLNTETVLPGASSRSFWLKGSAWEFPTCENADTFVERLAREEILVRDPLVDTVLREVDQPRDLAPRTVRYRFLRATGLTRSTIQQMQRAQYAASLLEQGASILDTVFDAGYFDQPHLTRALKHYVGYTPAQIVHMCQPASECIATVTEPTL